MRHLSSITSKTKTPKVEGKEDMTPNVYVGQEDPEWYWGEMGLFAGLVSSTYETHVFERLTHKKWDY